MKFLSLSNSPAAIRAPLIFVLFPTFISTSFPVRVDCTVCFIFVLLVFAPLDAFTDDTFPFPVLAPTVCEAAVLESTVEFFALAPVENPSEILNPFELLELESLRDSIFKSFPTFIASFSSAFIFAPIKFTSFEVF